MGDDGATDGPLESSSTSEPGVEAGPLPYDGGCYVVNTGGAPPTSVNGYNCSDSILASGITQDGGVDAGVVTAPIVYDDAGNEIEGGTVENGIGGISIIPSQYQYNEKHRATSRIG